MTADTDYLLSNILSPKAIQYNFDAYQRLCHNVHYLNDRYPQFTRAAKNLIISTNGHERSAIQGVFGTWLTDDGDVRAATLQVSEQGKDASEIRNVARFILEDVIKHGVLARIPVGGNHRCPEDHHLHKLGIVLSGGSGDRVVQEESLDVRPDLLSASATELNHYYHPIAVAGYVTKLTSKSRQTEQFIQGYAEFKEWVITQPDMTVALRAALEAQSINPRTIEALNSLRSETTSALYTGLL